MDIRSRLSRRLAEQRDKHLIRQHQQVSGAQQVQLNVAGQQLVNFASNDYLGLANHPEVQQAFIRAAETCGVGSGAAHLITGHNQLHHQLEEELAAFVGYERALLFSTGYMANVGVLTALTDRHDVIFQDKLNHASLIDGAQQSLAKLKRYKHLDCDDLERQILQHENAPGILVTDGVFSMEGDAAPLGELSRIAAGNDLMMMVDDAHGFGVIGDMGKGSVSDAGLGAERVHIYMGTLGKALGTFGAFVAASEEIIEGLIQFARSYVYTTATPPAIAAATLASLRVLQTDSERQEKLHANISFFRKGSQERGIAVKESRTAIQVIVLPDSQAAVRCKRELQKAGFLVGAIRPPTVPEPCLRITLSSAHSETQIEDLLNQLHVLVGK